MTQEKKSFGVLLFKLLAAPLAALPLSFHLSCSRFVAWVLRVLVRYRKDDVMINLSRSFPDKKYAEIKEIARHFYRHLGEIFTQAIWFGGCRGARGRKRFSDSRVVDLVNPACFNSLFDGSPGMMVLTSHTGNWELLGGWFNFNHDENEPLHQAFNELVVVYLGLKSKFWDRFIADNRCCAVNDTSFDGYVETRNVLRFALSNRERKLAYVFPTDQYPYTIAKKHSVGKFLSQETLAMTGGAALAGKLHFPVCYMRWTDTGDGRYKVELVPICKDAAEMAPEDIMKQYYSLLEKDIQAQPWNYLWTHRRWK